MFLVSTIYLVKKRKPILIVDRYLWAFPGWKTSLLAHECVTGSRDSLIDALKNDNLVIIYPGGMREAFYSNDNYDLIWESRSGFARVALEAQVPIVPMFTTNTRQVHFQINVGKEMWRRVYDKTRSKLAFIFVYCWFPVKLRTFVGEPIIPNYNMTQNDDNINKIIIDSKRAVESLIATHQKRPGSIIYGIYQRFIMNNIKYY
jgi:1-acyl-sn-glycerol-3-phosphate acyltransferase